MRGDEVLEDIEPFLEALLDRQLDHFAAGLVTRPFMPIICAIWPQEPRAPEWTNHVDRTESIQCLFAQCRNFVFDFRPDLDDLA